MRLLIKPAAQLGVEISHGMQLSPSIELSAPAGYHAASGRSRLFVPMTPVIHVRRSLLANTLQTSPRLGRLWLGQ